MAPKKAPLSSIAKLKAHLEAQKKAEEEQRKQEEEEEQRLKDELRLAEEQRKYEEKEKAKQKELDKQNKKEEKKEEKKNLQFEKLKRMAEAGMILPEIKGLENIKPQTIIKKENVADIKTENKQEVIIKQEIKPEFICNNFRSPICCVLGHVDAGKTSLLDKVRQTNVQKGEAGGITQQIGATFFPQEILSNFTKDLSKKQNFDIKIPGLLIMDTPGHEQFANLRSRGSSIADIAILVVDMFHGLEKQTIESIALLRKLKCPFVVALNKVDKLYDWKKNDMMDIQQTLLLQKDYVGVEYNTRVDEIKSQLAKEGFNSELYYKNQDLTKTISIVPTSAKTGEGIIDLVLFLIKLNQLFLENKISHKEEFKCSIIEVKPINGYGLTIDVILVNGTLCQGDKIILSGFNGPIITKVKYLLTPQPLQELRVKGDYIVHKNIKASQCVKISAENLEEVIPGTSLFLIEKEEDIDFYKKEASREVSSILNKVSKDKIGISIQSSTLGSLEALITLLEQNKIPIGNISLGPIHKKHIIHSIMMKQKNKKYALILAFDVEVTQDAKFLAEKEKIKIYDSKIIYHLADVLNKHIDEYNLEIKEKNKNIVVFPASLKILCCFRAKDPLVIGCKVEEGQIRVGTPLQVRTENGMSIGKVIGIQIENKDILIGKKGMELAIKLEGKTNFKFYDELGEEKEREQHIAYGRHINEGDTLCSKISRKSIDALKESFRDDMTDEDWQLIINLKKEQNIS